MFPSLPTLGNMTKHFKIGNNSSISGFRGWVGASPKISRDFLLWGILRDPFLSASYTGTLCAYNTVIYTEISQ